MPVWQLIDADWSVDNIADGYWLQDGVEGYCDKRDSICVAVALWKRVHNR